MNGKAVAMLAQSHEVVGAVLLIPCGGLARKSGERKLLWKRRVRVLISSRV